MKEIAATSHVRLFTDAAPIRFPEGIDEFVHYLHGAIQHQLSPATISYQQHNPTEDEPYFYFGYSAEADGLTSEIAFQPVTEGVLVWVGLVDDRDQDDQIQLWSDIVTIAVDKVLKGYSDYEWVAIIGPIAPFKTQFIVEPATIGGMIVSKSTSAYSEVTSSFVPNVRSWGVATSHPVTVEGVSKGYNWTVASISATENLNLLCALLSVALDANWRVRQAPRVGSASDQEIPRIHPLLAGFPLSDGDVHSVLEDDIPIPEWCAHAWRNVLDDSDLRAALHAYHQGVAIEETSPSFALIAYVGVVEGMGKHIEQVTRCETCGNVTQSARRFRKSLKEVLSNREVKELADVYDRRSKTAHEGGMFGNEVLAGAMPHSASFMPMSNGDEFRYKVVWKMRDATRRLLLHYLQR